MVKMLFMHIVFFSSNFKLITINKYKNGFGLIFHKLKKSNYHRRTEKSFKNLMEISILL